MGRNAREHYSRLWGKANRACLAATQRQRGRTIDCAGPLRRFIGVLSRNHVALRLVAADRLLPGAAGADAVDLTCRHLHHGAVARHGGAIKSCTKGEGAGGRVQGGGAGESSPVPSSCT